MNIVNAVYTDKNRTEMLELAMSSAKITIPEDLLRLKPSNALDSLSMSSLARKGTSVLQKVTSTAQAVAIKIQGQGAMVTLSQHQYDEMIKLIQTLHVEKPRDEFIQSLTQQFDDLMLQMNQSDAAQATETALFGDTAALNKSYQPGVTETKDL